MIVRALLSLAIVLILTACLRDEMDDPQTTQTPPTASPTATTRPQNATPTEPATASPTPSITPTAATVIPADAPSAEVCTHSWPYFRPDIFIMDAAGTHVRQVTPEGMIEGWDPGWSPDGSQIVFRGFDGQDDGIFVMDREGTNVRRLTDGDGGSSEPDWSPDGTRIVFVRQHPAPGGTHLYVINSDGTDLRQLTTFPGSVHGPVWSPDGTRIVYSSDQDGNYEIYVIDADGANLTRLTDRPTWDYDPSWSPDGERIMFDSTVFGEQARDADESELGIFVVDADGSNLQRVDALIPGDHEVRWSPDGEEFAFVHDYEIMVVDSGGGDRRNLTQHPLSDERPRWSPDGRSILFVSDRNLWPLAEPGPGQPEPIILRAGDAEGEGGAGSSCAWRGTSFHAVDVFGVWLSPDPLLVQAGAGIEIDFSALPDLSAVEVTVYDYEEAERIGKIADDVFTPPCAPPGGTEATCLEQRLTSPAIDGLDLPPGHYAIVVRANFGSGNHRGYTEQGFNLVVE